MATMDKKHIESYMQHKQAIDITISDMKIGEHIYSFSTHPVPGLPIHMLYPDSFEIMPEVSAKSKFPSDNRPQVILTNPVDETVNLLFTRTENTVSGEDIPNVAQGLQTVIKRMSPGAVLYQTGTIETEPLTICWFDYGSSALDDDLYNLMYVLCLHGKVLIGGFCCLREQRREWHPVVLQMLETIAVQEDGLNG